MDREKVIDKKVELRIATSVLKQNTFLMGKEQVTLQSCEILECIVGGFSSIDCAFNCAFHLISNCLYFYLKYEK